MKTPSLAALLLCLAGAVSAAPCDPSQRPEGVDALLAAMTDADKRALSLNQTGLVRLPDGKWSYMNGGVVTEKPMPRPLGQAYDLYCSYVARAEADARNASKRAAARAVPAAAETAPASASVRRVTQDGSGVDRAIKAMKASFASAEADVAVAPAAAKPACSSQVCTGLADCRDAGMGANNLGSDFRCRELAAQATNVCTCP